MSHLAQSRSKASLDKVRAEFDRLVLQPAKEEDPSLADLPMRDLLDKVLTTERAQDLEYATMVMQEGLRYQPSSPMSFLYYAKEDVTLGKYNFKKGDEFVLCFEGVGHSTAQWQRPMEFLPERFDQNNPLYLTPDGKKRHNCSWIPFHGGQRVCFGKTLAEQNLKILICYMTQKFNLKFEDPRYETEFPKAQAELTHYPDVWLKLTAY